MALWHFFLKFKMGAESALSYALTTPKKICHVQTRDEFLRCKIGNGCSDQFICNTKKLKLFTSKIIDFHNIIYRSFVFPLDAKNRIFAHNAQGGSRFCSFINKSQTLLNDILFQISFKSTYKYRQSQENPTLWYYRVKKYCNFCPRGADSAPPMRNRV